MRVAICLSGQPRYLEEGFFYIKKNILDKYNDVDVFVHTWWDKEYVNKDFLGTNIKRDCKYEVNTINKIKKYYDPISLKYESQIDFYIDAKNYGKQHPSSIPSMFYSIKESNDLKRDYENKNNFKYDLVIRCRFDVVINYFDLDLKDVDKYVYVGGEHHHGGQYNIPNDQFAISTSENIDFYSSVFENLQNYSNDTIFDNVIFCGEQILNHHFHKNDGLFHFPNTDKLLTNGWWQYSNNDCYCWDKYSCGDDIIEVMKNKEHLLKLLKPH